MSSTTTNVSTLKINRGTYSTINSNLASIGENELIITTDKNVPVPQVADSGKVVKVNASGEYELASATDVDTWRAIKVDGVEKLASNSNTALDLVAGTNITLTESSGAVTIAASGGTPTSISNSTINDLFGYAITTTISNGSASGATFIYNGETATITITPATGYVAPSSVTISNATQVSYDSSTGVLVIGSATDDVTITGACDLAPSGYDLAITYSRTVNGGAGAYSDVKLKMNSAPTSENDCDLRINENNPSGSQTFNDVASYYYWGTHPYYLDSTYIDNTIAYTNAVQVTLSANTSLTITAYYQCFLKGTQITLEDGTTKNVEDLTYSDRLRTWDFDTGQYSSAEICWLTRPNLTNDHYYKLTFNDGTILMTTGVNSNHRVYDYDKQKFVGVRDVQVGDRVFSENGILTITNKEYIEQTCEYYNVITSQQFDCFANGILTSDRYGNMYSIDSNMTFIKDNRQIRPYSDYQAFGIEFYWYDHLRLGEQNETIEKSLDYVNKCKSQMLPRN